MKWVLENYSAPGAPTSEIAAYINSWVQNTGQI